jgi:glutathione S-transferase
MPVDPQASVRISAFKWVPPFAQGYVRDLRARWALEEAGVPYAVRKLDAAVERPADYFEEQPFGQVPSYRDDTVSLFESGAIVLHVGRNCEALVKRAFISNKELTKEERCAALLKLLDKKSPIQGVQSLL